MATTAPTLTMNTKPRRSSNTVFRFTALPLELRRNVYKYLAPTGTRITLDPDNIKSPGAFLGTKGDSQVLKHLVVSKDFHREFLPILYANNTFILIKPLIQDAKLAALSLNAITSIRKLEFRVHEGISDLGNIWTTLVDKCHALNEITLVFYHDRYQWLKCLSDLALMDSPKPQLNLNLYSSIWSEHKSTKTYRDEILAALEAAERRRLFSSLKPFPTKITTINITASACDTAAYGLITAKRTGRAVFAPSLGEESEICSRLRWVGD